MLSNILQVQMHMTYLSTQITPQQYKPSTISHIITIRRHTKKRQRLPHKNATNSQPSEIPARVVNLVVQSNKALLFELFKLRSLSDFLIYRSGSPIARKSIRRNHTFLSFSESKIMVINECTKELQSLKHCAKDIGTPEAYSRTKIYKDNKASVQRAD